MCTGTNTEGRCTRRGRDPWRFAPHPPPFPHLGHHVTNHHRDADRPPAGSHTLFTHPLPSTTPPRCVLAATVLPCGRSHPPPRRCATRSSSRTRCDGMRAGLYAAAAGRPCTNCAKGQLRCAQVSDEVSAPTSRKALLRLPGCSAAAVSTPQFSVFAPPALVRHGSAGVLVLSGPDSGHSELSIASLRLAVLIFREARVFHLLALPVLLTAVCWRRRA